MTDSQTTAPQRVQAQSFWDPNRDQARGRKLLRLEVHNRCTALLQVPRGQLLVPGVQDIVVYDDQVRLIEALVEPRPEMLAQAQLSYRLAIAEEAKQRVEGFAGDAENFLEEVDSGRSQAAREAYEHVRARTALSPESLFRQSMKRDPLPLVSCKFVGEAEEPKREAVKIFQEENAKTTGVLGESIGAAIAEAQKPLVALLGELIKKLK